MRERTLQTPRSAKKEGEEVFPLPEQIPLQPVVKTMVKQVVPLQPVEATVEHISTCSLRRTPRRSRWMRLKEAVTPWRACARAGSWQDL